MFRSVVVMRSSRRWQGVIEVVVLVMPRGMTTVVSATLQFEQGGDGSPASESDQRNARRGIDDVPEVLGGGDPCEPNDEREYQGRQDMAGASL